MRTTTKKTGPSLAFGVQAGSEKEPRSQNSALFSGWPGLTAPENLVRRAEKRYKESPALERNSNKDRSGPRPEHRTQGLTSAEAPLGGGGRGRGRPGSLRCVAWLFAASDGVVMLCWCRSLCDFGCERLPFSLFPLFRCGSLSLAPSRAIRH